MRHTHDTTFSEKIVDFYKILEESEQFFIFIWQSDPHVFVHADDIKTHERFFSFNF
jgi:hypothetical protein